MTSARSAAQTNPAALDGRLGWLCLYTTPEITNRSLTELFTRALDDDRDAQRAGEFILSLWNSGTVDLADLSFFDRDLNYAARHIINFFISCQVNLRQLATYREIEPIEAAWGTPVGGSHE
ncbi:MAG: hypothetical protein R3180_00105 [Marinobacter sp.]|nr:hypothetical protein [Marinobacter sp.]